MIQLPVPPEDAHVLVVEDDANNRLVVVKLLGVAGVPPEQIAELEGDPLRHIRSQERPPHLILLDLQLPGKDGYTILQELRQEPALTDVTVIALTANVMRSDVDRAREAGFDGFIGKPIDARRFPEWIRRLLAGERVWAVT